MGRSGSGLCPTRDRFDDIGFPTWRPTADCKNPRVKSDQTQLVDDWVNQSWKDAAGGSNRRQLHVFLVGSSPDLSKTTRSKQNNTRSLPDLRKTHQILEKNTRFSLDLRKTHKICAVFEQNPVNCSWIWAKTRRSDQKPQDHHWI